MAHDVCPWWFGYFLVSPIRRLRHNANKILGPYVRAGMILLEPGPGMGFFTIEAARLVGPQGRVVAIDVQKKMIDSLRRRVQRRHLNDRTDLRLAQSDRMGITDLNAKVDFVLAFAVVHEMPDQGKFFKECFGVLKLGGTLLFSEPSKHIGREEFEQSLDLARKAGFSIKEKPIIQSAISALLVKSGRGRTKK
jgi:ubiquinone/menaquinone biosynthesis C-methylase UbiE